MPLPGHPVAQPPDGRPSGWRRGLRPARHVVAAVVGAVVVGLVLLILLRTTGFHPGPSVLAVSILPVLLLAAVPAALVAVLLRHRTLALVATALCVVWAVLYIPELGDGPDPAPPGWDTVRLVSANVLFSNEHLDAALAEIEVADPDVIVLQEMSPDHWPTLEASPLWAGYPERIATRENGWGSLILSRLPLEDERTLEVAGKAMPAATVVTADGPVDLVAVHTLPPTAHQGAWRAQLEALGEQAEQLDRPLLVGDFNATTDHRPFRDLLARGLEDGQRTGGTGWGATWPQLGEVVALPLLRIDHVLAGDGLRVVGLWVGEGPGSDHLPLIAEVAVAPG